MALASVPMGLPFCCVWSVSGDWAVFYWVGFVAFIYFVGASLTLAVPDARARLYRVLSLFCLVLLAGALWLGYDPSPGLRGSVRDLVLAFGPLCYGLLVGAHLIFATLVLERIARC